MTCRIANVLKSHGIGKGDRVGVYMPMCPTGKTKNDIVCHLKEGSCLPFLFSPKNAKHIILSVFCEMQNFDPDLSLQLQQ